MIAITKMMIFLEIHMENQIQDTNFSNGSIHNKSENDSNFEFSAMTNYLLGKRKNMFSKCYINTFSINVSTIFVDLFFFIKHNEMF